MRKSVSAVCTVLALLAASASAQDSGLTAPSNAMGGAFWQARVERDSLRLTPLSSTLALGPPAAQSLRLLGDYQFSSLRLGNTGGLRLTGGVLINLRAPSIMAPNAAAADTSSALPYAGVGYASASARGEWGFSADLGLAAQGLSSLRLDRLFNGAGGVGLDTGPKLLPMIRLGMNVAF